MVTVTLMLLALALLAAPAPAGAAASPPCPGVRFLVEPALVPEAGLAVDAIVVDADGMATIASGCRRCGPASAGAAG